MYNNFRGGFGGGNMQNLLRQAQNRPSVPLRKEWVLKSVGFARKLFP